MIPPVIGIYNKLMIPKFINLYQNLMIPQSIAQYKNRMIPSAVFGFDFKNMGWNMGCQYKEVFNHFFGFSSKRRL